MRDPSDRLWQGTSLETILYHELRVYKEISRKYRPISYYRTASGVEVDFIIETAIRRPDSPPHLVAIEVKRAERWDRTWDKALRGPAENSAIQVDRLIGVYCGQRSYRFDKVEVWPYRDFVKSLFAGEIF